ncbi:MAG: hypothetical protein IMY86_13955 [Chloroflexi bacterium]|nr:hypothetical protein [Chloroflexota bacterium]
MVTVQVEGANEISAWLKRQGHEFATKRSLTALRKAASPVYVAMVLGCPVRTGRLQRSIKIQLPKKRYRWDYLAVKVGPARWNPVTREGSPHAWLVELGTVHSAAKPFVYPALKKAKGEAFAAAQKYLTGALKRFERRGRR